MTLYGCVPFFQFVPFERESQQVQAPPFKHVLFVSKFHMYFDSCCLFYINKRITCIEGVTCFKEIHL